MHLRIVFVMLFTELENIKLPIKTSSGFVSDSITLK